MIKNLFLAALTVFPFAAIAQEATPISSTMPLTRVEVDEANNKIKFVINDKTMAVLDEAGLEVFGRSQSEVFRPKPKLTKEPMSAPSQ